MNTKWYARVVGEMTDGDLVVYYRNRPGSRFTYQWVMEGHITEDQARYYQNKAGYAPAGYGFGLYRVAKKKDGTLYTYWESANNCD